MDRSFDDVAADLSERRQRAAETRSRGDCWSARQRIDYLVDPDSFLEWGRLSHSDVPGFETRTPADGIIGGIASVSGRQAVVLAIDSGVLAGTEGRVHLRKWHHFHEYAVKHRLPIFHLAEGGGLRIPDGMGSDGISQSMMPIDLLRHGRQVPLLTAILGDSFGGPTWTAVSSDFVTQVEGTTMAAVGPRMLEVATGERINPEDLGGVSVQAVMTGQVDHVAKTESEALDTLKKVWSYLPAHGGEAPPTTPSTDDPHRLLEDVGQLVPLRRQQAYDMRRLVRQIFDQGSVFEVGERFGAALLTSLARLDGQVVGVVANQPMVQAGAAGPDEADKATAFICWCDSFHIPLVFLHDIPGFRVGSLAEQKKMPTKIMVWNQALAWATVPKISVVVRKSIGAAYSNMAGPQMGSDLVVAWPGAEISFTGPEVGINVVYKKQLEASDNPDQLRQKFLQQWQFEVSPYPAAGQYWIHDVIDPKTTRRYLVQVFRSLRAAGPIMGKRQLANWPTGF